MATQLTTSGKTAFKGTALPSWSRGQRHAITRTSVAVKAQHVSRREGLLGFVAGVGTLLTADASLAAYGDAANILGKTTDTSGFIPYNGPGYALKIPSKWNPSKERDFPGVEIRYEDNQEAVTNFVVIVRPSDKGDISSYGSQEAFLKSTVGPLLGTQVFAGETLSEGGFDPNKVSSASLLAQDVTKDKNGKSYYTYEILTKSADGNEGGRHHVISASVGGGKLYILKAQAGDKRWFKGVQKDIAEMIKSFTVG